MYLSNTPSPPWSVGSNAKIIIPPLNDYVLHDISSKTLSNNLILSVGSVNSCVSVEAF